MSQLCTPVQQIYPDHVDQPSIKLGLGVFYSLILVLALVGNFVVLYALKFRPINFNVRNVFIWSLTLADLSVCLFSLPPTAIYTVARQWFFGEFMCILVPLLQASSVYITSFTVMAIAVDRYLLLCNPNGYQMSFNTAISFIIILWVLGIGASIPYAYVMNVYVNMTIDNVILNRTVLICGEFCDEHWQNPDSQTIYGIFALTLQFALPLAVCAICYGRIVVSLRRNYIRRISEISTSIRSKLNLAIRRKRVNKMIGLMLMSFFFAWLPLNALNVLRDFSMVDNENPWYSTLFALGHIAAMSSLIWNPVIYSFCNDQFRAMFHPGNMRRCSESRRDFESRRSTMGNIGERSAVVASRTEVNDNCDIPNFNGSLKVPQPKQKVHKKCSFAGMDNESEIFL